MKPSIYRRNLGSLDAILALHVDVEILLGFTFFNSAEIPRSGHEFSFLLLPKSYLDTSNKL